MKCSGCAGAVGEGQLGRNVGCGPKLIRPDVTDGDKRGTLRGCRLLGSLGSALRQSLVDLGHLHRTRSAQEDTAHQAPLTTHSFLQILACILGTFRPGRLRALPGMAQRHIRHEQAFYSYGAGGSPVLPVHVTGTSRV